MVIVPSVLIYSLHRKEIVFIGKKPMLFVLASGLQLLYKLATCQHIHCKPFQMLKLPKHKRDLGV